MMTTQLQSLQRGLIKTLKIIAVMIPMMAMVICVILNKYFDVNIDELYFLSMTIGMGVLSLLYLPHVDGNIFKTAIRTSATFWGGTSLVYVVSWVFFNDPHTFILWCFVGGVIIGICSMKWLEH